MEDLDPPRVVAGAAETIVEDLRWLGFDWDEGPDVGGPHPPYTQSARANHYRSALDRLARDTFACTCSRKEIAAASAPHGVEGLGVRYPGTCRRGPSHPERPPAIRFRMPEPPPDFEDGVHGPVEATDYGGDFVLRRADGLFAYQLAVVVDDIAMGVTEVIRGADLLASTPRQIAIYRALGVPPPRYAHIPLVLGGDGARLSKRDGALAIGALRDMGVSADAIVGRVAESLGFGAGEPTPLRSLIGAFALSKIPKTPVHDLFPDA